MTIYFAYGKVKLHIIHEEADVVRGTWKTACRRLKEIEYKIADGSYGEAIRLIRALQEEINRDEDSQSMLPIHLTPREREVLNLVSQGMNSKEIARRLSISEATVRAHVEHMRVRTGASTRAALVALYLQTTTKPNAT